MHRTRMTGKAATVLFTSIAPLTLVACGKPAVDRIAEEPVPTMRDGTDTAEMADGGNVTLPDDLPDDVYLPSDHVLRSVEKISGGRILHMTSASGVAVLYAEADEFMVAHDWEEQAPIGLLNDEYGVCVYKKVEGDDIRLVAVTIRQDFDGQTWVDLQLGDRSSGQ